MRSGGKRRLVVDYRVLNRVTIPHVVRSSGTRSAPTAMVVGTVFLERGCAAVDIGGVSLVPMAGSSLLTVITAATGYAYQVYFIKGLSLIHI